MVSNIEEKKIYLDKNVERQILKSTEGDNKYFLFGINNIVLSLIKVEEELSIEFFHKIFSFFPINFKIIGLIYIYNDSLYEDFDDIVETSTKELGEFINNPLLKNYFHLTNNSSLLNLLVKEVLYLTNLEFEISDIIDYTSAERVNADFIFGNYACLLKEEYNLFFSYLSYTKEELSNNKIIYEIVSKKFESIQDSLYINFGEDCVVALSEIIKNSSNNEFIEKIISRYITSPQKIASLNNKEIISNLKLNDTASISSFHSERVFEIQIKDSNNNFISLLSDSEKEKSSQLKNSDSTKNNINVFDCLVISKKFNSIEFTGSIVDCIKRLLANINSYLNDNENKEINHKILFNQILFPTPLLINSSRKEDKEVLLNKLLISFTDYIYSTKCLFYPASKDSLLTQKKIINPHLNLKTEFSSTSKTSVVKGLYEFHHYNQDNFNDDGWGCAYRSLQCLYSWFILNGVVNSNEVPNTPSIPEIQKVLFTMEDKPKSFVGSKTWIGSFEVNLVLNQCLKVESCIMHLTSGADLKTKARELLNHFDNVGTPIMIGGGVYAYTILGINYDYTSGDCKFLILDPHYKDKDEINIIMNKGGIAWRTESIFDKGNFYNLCIPQIKFD